ncbi:MAG TPA: hypothetical protein VFZ18_06285 [Longimicrobiaceae bacterium]
MSLIRRAAAAVLGPEVEAPVSLPADSVPAGVVLRRGRLIPWIGGLLAKSRHPAAAVTLRGTIILDPTAQLTPQLLEHELEHVRQWKADPLFPLRYTLATLRHGYYDNPYEVQARAAAARRQDSEVRRQKIDDSDI